jgi:hypothetical protein
MKMVKKTRTGLRNTTQKTIKWAIWTQQITGSLLPIVIRIVHFLFLYIIFCVKILFLMAIVCLFFDLSQMIISLVSSNFYFNNIITHAPRGAGSAYNSRITIGSKLLCLRRIINSWSTSDTCHVIVKILQLSCEFIVKNIQINSFSIFAIFHFRSTVVNVCYHAFT